MAAIKSEMITFPSNGEETPGYLVCPDDDQKHPAIVVIQEWWGLVPHIKEVAERFVRQGQFVCLAPDLYHGGKAEEPDEARKLAMALDRERAVAEIEAAIHYLRERDDVSPKQVGLVGWCMGGGLALWAATSSENVGAVVAYYGRPLEKDEVSQLEAPVLGLYAEQDQGIPVEKVRAFESALEETDLEHDIRIYPGVHHAFFNDTRDVYDPDAAMDAWERTLAWFKDHLRE